MPLQSLGRGVYLVLQALGVPVVCGGSSSWGGVPEVHGWSFTPRAESRRPFPSLLCLLPYPSALPRHCGLSAERATGFFSFSIHGQADPSSPAFTFHLLCRNGCAGFLLDQLHLLCCCYSLCGPVPSLSGAQMDRSLRCPDILCRGALFPLQLWISN